MRIKKYPKEIYILWTASFLRGIDLMSVFLIPFFMDWGGLSQFQTQLLQSWFTLLVFALEIPTGLIGDVKGRKFSVLCGFLFLTIGPIVYGSIPDFKIFLIGELLFAIGIAFISGAQEALLYDTLKDSSEEKSYSQVKMINDNLNLVGMLASSFLAGFFRSFMAVNRLFQASAITSGIIFLLILFLINEPRVALEKDFVPNYKEVFKRAISSLRRNSILRRLITFLTMIAVPSYFVIWFYQVIMTRIGVEEGKFGFYRVILISGEIVLSYSIIRLLDKTKNKRALLRYTVFLMILGFLAPVYLQNVMGVVMFIVLAGGVGLKYQVILSSFLNSQVRSSERATTLSFVSMLRRLLLTVANPIFGYLADFSMNLSLMVLAGILVLTGVCLLPRNEDLRN